jgi:hypothetical protein
MNDSTKQIQEWQEKLRSGFGDASKLQEYLFETLNNFYYRYLETTQNKNLATQELAPHAWGTLSYETNMVEALKTKNPLTKSHLIDFAKAHPKATNPRIRYGLWVEVKELKAEHGELKIISEVSWDFPEFLNKEKGARKTIVFKYDDLGVFRKELAKKLEEACELFT